MHFWNAPQNIQLEPTMTSSPRRRSSGLQNPDSSHDQIQCFWLAEVRNYTNNMIEFSTNCTVCNLHTSGNDAGHVAIQKRVASNNSQVNEFKML